MTSVVDTAPMWPKNHWTYHCWYGTKCGMFLWI